MNKTSTSTGRNDFEAPREPWRAKFRNTPAKVALTIGSMVAAIMVFALVWKFSGDAFCWSVGYSGPCAETAGKYSIGSFLGVATFTIIGTLLAFPLRAIAIDWYRSVADFIDRD